MRVVSHMVDPRLEGLLSGTAGHPYVVTIQKLHRQNLPFYWPLPVILSEELVNGLEA